MGEGNLLDYAAIEDSSTYLYDLDVSLIEKDEANNIIKTIPLDTTSIFNKDSGLFYHPHQILYTTGINNTVFLNENSKYHLKIHNPKFNKDVTSKTPIVKDFPILNPLTNPTMTTTFYDNDFSYTFKWGKAENGKIYYPYINIHIKEITVSNDTIYRTLKWKFPSHLDKEEQKEVFKHNIFYKFIDDNVPYKNAEEEANITKRYAEKIVFNVEVVSEEFYTYLSIYKPSNSIVETVPEYSNIKNGKGLLASKYHKTKPFYFSLKTLRRLAEKDYKFVMP